MIINKTTWWIGLIVFLIGTIVGTMLPRCSSDKEIGTDAIIIKSDSSFKINKIKEEAKTIPFPKRNIKPRIKTGKDSIKLTEGWNKIDTLINQLGEMDSTATIIFMYTLTTANKDTLIQGFDLLHKQFLPTQIIRTDSMLVINNSLQQICKRAWYEKPEFTVPMTALITVMILEFIKK